MNIYLQLCATDTHSTFFFHFPPSAWLHTPTTTTISFTFTISIWFIIAGKLFQLSNLFAVFLPLHLLPSLRSIGCTGKIVIDSNADYVYMNKNANWNKLLKRLRLFCSIEQQENHGERNKLWNRVQWVQQKQTNSKRLRPLAKIDYICALVGAQDQNPLRKIWWIEYIHTKIVSDNVS